VSLKKRRFDWEFRGKVSKHKPTKKKKKTTGPVATKLGAEKSRNRVVGGISTWK